MIKWQKFWSCSDLEKVTLTPFIGLCQMYFCHSIVNIVDTVKKKSLILQHIWSAVVQFYFHDRMLKMNKIFKGFHGASRIAAAVASGHELRHRHGHELEGGYEALTGFSRWSSDDALPRFSRWSTIDWIFKWTYQVTWLYDWHIAILIAIYMFKCFVKLFKTCINLHVSLNSWTHNHLIQMSYKLKKLKKELNKISRNNKK